MSSLGQSAGDHKNRELSTFCLGKNKGRLRSGNNSLPVSLRQGQCDMLGRGRVLRGSRDTGEEAQGFLQGAGREPKAQPFCRRLGTLCSANLTPGLSSFSLTYATEGRTSLPTARASHDKALGPVSDTVIKAIKDPNLF